MITPKKMDAKSMRKKMDASDSSFFLHDSPRVHSPRPFIRMGKRILKGLVLASVSIVTIASIFLVFNATTNHDTNGADRDIFFTLREIPLPQLNDTTISTSKHNLKILSDAIKIRTISYGDDRDSNLTTRQDFGQFIKTSFPLIHNSCIVDLKVIEGASLLYEIKGNDTAKKPYLLISHMDVVPAENKDKWDKNPFGDNNTTTSDDDEEEYLYGRGALDIKSSIIGILASIETKFSQNEYWQPRRTILVFIGHDEEIGGYGGAKIAAKQLINKNTKLEFILDEGGAATKHYFPGLDNRIVCLIGVAEKGFLSIDLESTLDAGHSSMPRENSAIRNLAKAITALADHPLPYHFESDDINRQSFEWIAPHMSFVYRVVMSNMWLFKKFVLSQVSKTPETKALARTTTAFTMMNGGVKENVLPIHARALVNHRIHPRDNFKTILDWDRNVIKDIDGVNLKEKTSEWKNAASPISPYDKDHAPFHVIKSGIHTVFPNALVTPYLTVGGTDSKHFVELTENIYRFVPYILDKELNDAKRIHGINERINKKDFLNYFIRFYTSVIELADTY